jgi:hypothetical protein
MCFQRGDLSATAAGVYTIDAKNNIFNNTRSGGTGKHYAISNNYGAVTSTATGWGANASDYNVLNSNAATIGYWSGDQTFSTWKTASSSDSHSLSGVSVIFSSTATGDLHMNMGLTQTPIESGGMTLVGYSTDFDGQTRPGPVPSVNGGGTMPDIGADEFDGVPPGKTLNLTGVILQGLYNGTGSMVQAYDQFGPHWPAGVADHITVELHDASTYGTIIYTAANIALSTTGTASMTIPATYGGTYYITIKNRNHLQTVSAVAVSFSGGTISRSFATPADVYGGNLMQMHDLGYAIYGGDVNQDGIIDSSDGTNVDNLSASAAAGYLPEDCNGDGLVDLTDGGIVDNGAALAIGAITP